MHRVVAAQSAVAKLETLIGKVENPELREQLLAAAGEAKSRLDWGLVFERHLPEQTRLLAAPVRMGTVVWERRSAQPRRLRVRAVDGDELIVVAEAENTTADKDAPTERITRNDVLVEHDLAQPVYPVPTPIDSIRRATPDRPAHLVIEGENYDALAVLLTTHARAFDLLYLDPPYNTGARDWSYNNDYVDPNDTYRSSKWLAFMERRLKLGRRLVKDDGVIVVTIDEHEVHHLGMLLETTYADARIQMVTIVVNPAGVDQGGLSRVEEYAFFCFFGNAKKPFGLGDDLLAEESRVRTRDSAIRWEQLLRAGNNSARADRPNLFYPVFLDPVVDKVVGVGEPLFEGEPDPGALIDGKRAVWPVRENGTWGNWRNSPATMQALLDEGYVRPGRYSPRRKTWVIYYVSKKIRSQIESGEILKTERDDNGVVVLAFADVPRVAVKTVWHRVRHNAPMSGSQLLLAFMGRQSAFPFPKSLYAVRDTIDILTRDNRDALVLDFFAGSGTTLHATALLNEQDGGRRRCFLVTNNEVRATVAAELAKHGVYRGDPEFEAEGVFESATKPRVTAAVTGLRPDGSPVPGLYFDGREFSEGFSENVEFLRLDYLDGAEIDYGLRFADLNPLLWMWAGGIGDYTALDATLPVAIAPASPYAVLFDPAGLLELNRVLADRADISHVFVVADSPDTYSQVASEVAAGPTTIRLYRTYLDGVRSAVQ
jgi:adenine-specific DNA-methyltransferase